MREQHEIHYGEIQSHMFYLIAEDILHQVFYEYSFVKDIIVFEEFTMALRRSFLNISLSMPLGLMKLCLENLKIINLLFMMFYFWLRYPQTASQSFFFFFLFCRE